ncbi:MAG TPA: FecR domain-containing protein [Usitatibacter sp.]|nr:FecR domain-containing protein [Usitatibacter sp.]
MRNDRKPLVRMLAAMLAATPLIAGAAAGEFSFVTGEVTLIKANGQRSSPVKGTLVDPGDRVTTGTNGMAQLTMVDNARLSLRPATQFQIEAYPQRPDSADGAVLSLLRGTLRTFTGLLASTNRDKFVMKTRVATVGIRGSGNILYACEGQDCDESVGAAAQAPGGATINHTIEGSHAVTNIASDRPGLPAPQGGSTTVITGPGQTVLVAGNQAPRYIPTPRFIGETATNPTAAKQGPAEGTATTAAAGDTRNFSPSDTPALPAAQTTSTPVVGNNGLGFVSDIEANNLASDPLRLQDVVIAAGSPFSGQALDSQVTRVGGELRGYTSYSGSQSGIEPAIVGGTSRDSRSLTLDGVAVSMGRYENASLGFFGTGSASAQPGSIHWISAASGYPAFLADVLTGEAQYHLVSATSPTNQNNTAGTLTSATLFANFTSRTMGLDATVTIPSAGANAGGTWRLSTGAVPFSFNMFFASTSDLLIITNGTQTSTNNSAITGSFEGSFVGTGLAGAILGYGISDRTSSNAANWNFISGVAAFQGPRSEPGTPYREGRVSDPNNSLLDFIRSYSTTNRTDEVTSDAQGRVTAFSAPFQGFGPHASYQIGTAQVVQSGVDAETGLVWGRWGGGIATASRGNQSFNIQLGQASLHYIFAAPQSGPVALPLSGTASYDVIGSTSPTNSSGAVGTLGTATLDANFTARTVTANVNIAIANQNWSGTANNMPIYREQYFSAYSGTPIPGLPNPNPLIIGCTPNCGTGATGSFDGFFTGRNGQRAGLMYNLGGNQGAIAFGRRGG